MSVWGADGEIVFCVSADWKVLKNRKFLGSVSEQNIRTKSRPVIQELQPQYVPLSVSLSFCSDGLLTVNSLLPSSYRNRDTVCFPVTL